MKIFKLLPLFALLAFVACNDDDDTTSAAATSEFEMEFDNVFGDGANQRDFTLNAVGDTDYPYTNELGQPFNVTFLRYFISEVTLHNEDGTDYNVPMSVSADDAEGFFLIRAEASGSSLVRLDNVPVGNYNAVSFTIGVDSNGVVEGAAGGILDPVANQMFWSWNAGYVALKVEGQSPNAAGGAFGNTIDTSVANAFVYHIGGWKEIAGTPLAYNNRRVRLEFFDNAIVEEGSIPHAHLEVDVQKMIDGVQNVDFTGNNNVHSPADGKALGLPDNMESAFRFDHLHQ